MTTIQQLLEEMVRRGCSDLHITAGVPPIFRIDGELAPSEHDVLKPQMTEQLAYSLMNDAQKKTLAYKYLYAQNGVHLDLDALGNLEKVKMIGAGLWELALQGIEEALQEKKGWEVLKMMPREMWVNAGAVALIPSSDKDNVLDKLAQQMRVFIDNGMVEQIEKDVKNEY